eukprot:tig00000670_g3020.t1
MDATALPAAATAPAPVIYVSKSCPYYHTAMEEIAAHPAARQRIAQVVEASEAPGAAAQAGARVDGFPTIVQGPQRFSGLFQLCFV